jgi:alpha-galactosidase
MGAEPMRWGATNVFLPVVVGFLTVVLTASPAREDLSVMAPVPPMGWNSWDAWGLTIDEQQFRDTTTWFHNHLQRFGYQYVVIDEGWFAQHPENPTGQQDYTISPDGRTLPAINRFPSAANDKGFAPLAEWVHSMGLKFGIHIVRGIPRSAVEQNLLIAHSHYRASEAADTTDKCEWNSDNYGLKDNKAAQAYYNSLADLYARWGVDFLKVDCISRPWHAAEIHMMRRALDQTGRAIVLSLSPGPTPIEDADDAVRSAQMWRISDDMWDLWSGGPNAPQFPESLDSHFARLAAWEQYAGPGHWPDADMLPVGYLGPHPGWGEPRVSRLTHDEVRTLVTLWCITRSPLFVGTNLLKMDAFTESAITNPEVLAVDQESENNRPVIQTKDTIVWMASPPEHHGEYVAIFNVSDQPETLTYTWQDLGITYGKCPVRDLWKRDELGINNQISVTLAPHASAIFQAEHR